MNYIEVCLLSIYHQTYDNIELVIVDDCSTDRSLEKIYDTIKKYNFNDRFKKMIFEKNEINHGAHYTINKGIELSSGQYISVINADDVYEKTRVANMLEELRKTDGDLAFSKVDIIDGRGNKLHTDEANHFRRVSESIKEKKYVSHALMYQNCSISTGNLLFKKELYTKLGGFKNYKYVHDWDFLLRACLLKEPIYVDNTVYYYRIHSSNSYKDLQGIADVESKAVLTSFFYNIKMGAQNPALDKNKVKNELSHSWLIKYWNQSNIISYYINKIKFQIG